MEFNSERSILELNINDESKSNFTTIAQWLLISAVVGFSSLGISIIAMFKVISSSYNSSATIGAVVSTMIVAVISLLLNITLINAANNLKKGISMADQGHFNLGLQKLATYYRIVGIILIIVLIICVFAVLVGILAGSGGYR